MQGYENVILMHLSVFSPRAGGVGVMQGDLATNKYPTHGIRTPTHVIPGVGNYDTSSGNFFIKL